ncbi:apolipoprotein N-acyltransferase [Sphingomonas corticis]|jgi:apolipoprotein N-acyltransferase|uniref:Apolipoprotein N-acyltransferase n=1 Tax=Sphingomonas corticis TaxID=2722791 RepID=A0ABX1CR44_9SPHN|nr:apolipoprotein N-acyltransferase [Sphingomonas corticis]NJR78790.1 apolipoprotein N-acyltransferase [Sphingomonas corticis]
MRFPAPLSLLLGVVTACAFAPLDLWWLALPALAAWMWLVHAAPSARQALWRGYAFGVGHFTINDNWFQHAFTFQDKMPAELGYIAPFALALYLAVYPALAAGLAWRMRRERVDTAWVLFFAAAWMLGEWLRSWVFTGYAWDPLGVAWLGLPIPHVALLGREIGTYALSALFVAAAGALLLLLARRRWPLAAAIVALVAVQVVRGTPALPPPPAGAPRLVVVQPNVPQDQRGESDQEMMLARLTRLSGRPAAVPRLVLWPEGVMRNLIEGGYPLWVYGATSPWATRARLASVLGPRDILMTGGDALQFDARGDVVAATNSVFALNSGRQVEMRYDKSHLVPYGEYLPMPWLLKPLGLARLVPGEMDFLPGPGPETSDLPLFGPVAVQICYEIIFSGEVIDRDHRPLLLFNPSNDAWFGSWGPPQHLRQAQMRAIEEGVPVARSTPNGISAVIAADGRVLAQVPHKVAGAIDVPIPPALPPTHFSRIGNWAALIVGIALVAAAIALRRRAR